MRSAPISTEMQDILQSVEDKLAEVPGIPAEALIANEFTGISDPAHKAISHLARCCESIVHLQFQAEYFTGKKRQKILLGQAVQIYMVEMQRLLGGLFHVQDPFWSSYYTRHNTIQQYAAQPAKWDQKESAPAVSFFCHRYNLFFVTLDAIDRCSNHQNQLAYELLLQSLQRAVSGYYLPSLIQDFNRLAAFRTAQSLVESLELPVYKSWLNWQIANDGLNPSDSYM